MFVKLLRSVAIGLIVGAILLVAMPSLRSLNPLSTPQFDSTDETPASYNLIKRQRVNAHQFAQRVHQRAASGG